jgi:tetratricopeptide (TPR) repeat protein
MAYLGARHFALASSPAMRIPFTDNPLVGAGFLAARLTAIKVLGKELALAAWPAHLSCDYSYNAIPLSTGLDMGVLAGAGALLGLAGVALGCYRLGRDNRNGRGVFFLLAFGFAALLPTSNLLIPIGTIMAERLLYVPAAAFAGCLAAAGFAVARRLPTLPPAALYAALATIALLYAGRTFVRNFDWKTETTLWTSAESVVPGNYRPHTSLAEGDLETAVRETDRALAILDPLPDPWNTPVPYINAGKVYSDKGDTLAAPENARWYRRSVDTLLRGQRIQAALDALRRLAHPTTWSVLDEQLGRDYLRLAQYGPAAAAFERALATRFTPALLGELASAYQAQGDTRRAAIALFEGMEWQPQNTHFAGDLVALYTRQMPGSCAVLSSGASYRLNQECPLVREHICAASETLISALERSGQPSEAARIRNNAGRSGCR